MTIPKVRRYTNIKQKEVRRLFSYNPKTGVFIRKTSTSPRARKGDVVGFNSSGYLRVHVNGKNLMLHRIAWVYVYGEADDKEIDHINHNKTDNRIANLRSVSHKENGRNQALSKNNKTGCHGVWRRKNSGRWAAEIKVAGKKISLGGFSQKEDAIRARKMAEIRYGFHPNHGA